MVARRLRSLVLITLSLPLALLMRVLRPVLLVRVGGLKAGRIGHFAANTEMYLVRKDLGSEGRRTLDLFYLPTSVSNDQLATMWRRTIRIFPFVRYVFRANSVLPGGRIHKLSFPSDRDTEDLLSRKQPHLEFTRDEIDLGLREMEVMGVPTGSDFVCFHARDSTYLDQVNPHQTWQYHRYRDCDVNTFVPAMNALVQSGYHALRMGSVVEKPLDTTVPGIIDYATHWRTDFLDIFLSARCRFFVGCGSGIDEVAKIFRRPWARANIIPLEYASGSSRDLFVPKKLWKREASRLLTFREMVESGLGHATDGQEFENAGVDIVDNTPEEITAVVLEMDARMNGTWQETDEDLDLQNRFRVTFASSELQGSSMSRIGAEFLRQNRELLD